MGLSIGARTNSMKKPSIDSGPSNMKPMGSSMGSRMGSSMGRMGRMGSARPPGINVNPSQPSSGMNSPRDTRMPMMSPPIMGQMNSPMNPPMPQPMPPPMMGEMNTPRDTRMPPMGPPVMGPSMNPMQQQPNMPPPFRGNSFGMMGGNSMRPPMMGGLRGAYGR